MYIRKLELRNGISKKMKDKQVDHTPNKQFSNNIQIDRNIVEKKNKKGENLFRVIKNVYSKIQFGKL